LGLAGVAQMTQTRHFLPSDFSGDEEQRVTVFESASFTSWSKWRTTLATFSCLVSCMLVANTLWCHGHGGNMRQQLRWRWPEATAISAKVSKSLAYYSKSHPPAHFGDTGRGWRDDSPSLFCWSQMMPLSDEENILKYQLKEHVGIFACN